MSIIRKINNIVGPTGRSLQSRDAVIKHYLSISAGAWLHRARNVQFKKPVEPIKWLLCNKPSYEIHSLDLLVSCLGRVINIDDTKKMRLFHIYANAYSYILKNEPARKDMKDAFDALINEGKKPEGITVLMMQDKMDLLLFTHLDNNDKYLNLRYINTIIEVYLYFKDLAVRNELHVPEFE